MGGKRGIELLDKLYDNSIPITECGCLIWLGGISKHGYGKIRFGDNVLFSNRASWIAHFGEIPNGLHVLHKCDIRCCIEPTHLFLGTNADNVRDKTLKLRTPHGYNHHKAKVDEAEVLNIKNSNETLEKLASIYDMSISGIWNIKQGNRRIYNK